MDEAIDGCQRHDVPCWMMRESAAHHELRLQPRLLVEHLRDLRIEVDSLLDFLQSDSPEEKVVDEAPACEAASGSVREGRSSDRCAARSKAATGSAGSDHADRDRDDIVGG